jgi:hypothetical protein
MWTAPGKSKLSLLYKEQRNAEANLRTTAEELRQINAEIREERAR